MNATQTRIIEEARRNGGRASIEAGSGRGARGGRVSYGSRDLIALNALVDAGVVRIVNRDSSDHWSGNGNTVRQTVFVYEIV